MIEELGEKSGKQLVDAAGVLEECANEIPVKEENGFLRLINKFRLYSQQEVNKVTRQDENRE